ncbi:MAG: radical SAM protein [Bryobacteraceae bacterium]|jgi:MoaA/NifB/PqqE/SkfB family radical SAM enzyme
MIHPAMSRLASSVRGVSRLSWDLLTRDSLPIEEEGVLYDCRLTAARRRNLALQMINHRHLGYRLPALPHLLHIGVTTYCNLSCPACPTGNKALGRPAQHLDFDLYRRTIDELRDVLMLMLFWDWGEPLMHPRVAEMIEYASRHDIMSLISTNGTVANSERQLESLVAAQPRVLIVCVDGVDQATHEKYRTGGGLNKVLDTARRLVKIRERLKVAYPAIEFRTLANRENEAQLPDLLRMAQDVGADMFSLKSLCPHDFAGTSVDDQLVPVKSNLSRYVYASESPAQARRLDFVRRGALTCAKPHRCPNIYSNGDLGFCCFSGTPLEVFGSLTTQSFRSLWGSAFARDLRVRFAAQGGSASCWTCYHRTAHKPIVLFRVPLRPIPPRLTIQCPTTAEEFLRAVAPAQAPATEKQTASAPS